MKIFLRVFRRYSFYYSLLRFLLVTMMFLNLYLVFFKAGFFWALVFSSIPGVLYSVVKMNTVKSRFDELTGAKGVVKASYEFCTIKLPGSEDLKEKTVKNGLKLLIRKSLFGAKFSEIATLSILTAVLLFVPRFGAAKYNMAVDLKVVPSGDTILILGQDLKFTVFPAENSMGLEVVVDGEKLASFIENDSFSALLLKPQRNLDFRIQAKNDTLSTGYIYVRSPPLTCRSALLVLPIYLGGGEYNLESKKEYIVPEGSVLRFVFESDARIEKWNAEGGVLKDESPGSVTWEIVAMDSALVILRACSFLGDTVEENFRINVIKDRPPVCRLTFPSDRVLQVDFDKEYVLKFETQDDYGLTSSQLLISQDNRDEAVQGVSLEGKGPLEINYSFYPGDYFSKPGDTLLAYARTADNSPEHQTSYSETLLFVMPDLYQIFSRSDSVFDTEKTSSFIQKGRDLMREIEVLEQRLKLSDSVNFEEQRDFQELLKDHESLIDQISRSLDDMDLYLEYSAESFMLDSMILDKTREIAEIYRDLLDEETKKAFERLYELAENADEEEIEKILRELKIESEELVESLDRTIDLLRRLQIEKKLEELSRRTLEAAQRSANLSTSDRELMGRQIKNIEDDISRILEEIDELETELIPDEALDEIEDSEMQGEMAMEEIQKMSNYSSSEGLTGKLSSMASHLQKASQIMSGSRMQRAAFLVNQIKETALGISELEESISKGETDQILSLASLQSVIRAKNALDSVSSVSSLAENNIVELFSLMQNELEKTNEAIDHRAVMKLANDAYRDLERIERLMENYMSGSNSGMLQQLSQMGGEQANIGNSISQSLNGNYLSQSQLAQIAARQRALSEKLSQISGNSNGSAWILSELQEIARQMELSANAIERGEVTRELVDRQRGILQKLLESQRALREQRTRPERVAQRPEGEFRYPFFIGIDNLIEQKRSSTNTTSPLIYEDEANVFFRYLIKRYHDAGF
ncbi:hypothetical protein JXA84_03465 [candidate division WOR-3 bacterium]|nr:hypothetical protein [candidate division WOR-3 bacterium]